MTQKKQLAAIICLICFLIFFPFMAAANTDHSIYADLLKEFVNNGRVDYIGFKKNEARLDRYLNILSQTNADALSRNEQFAFYINAYNAFTIKLILSKYPQIKSIKDIGGIFSGPWSIEFIPLKSQKVTLDHIEHDILRPVFKDPRVHFAVNCASKSCPPLRSEPYTGESIDEQLEQQAVQFLNAPENTVVKGNKVYVSKLFKWFKKDFDNDPIGFIKKYASDSLRRQLDSAGPDIKVGYLEYDWSLNQ